jgi:hypothetical protein
MPQAFLVVRSVVSDPSLRARFDHWYATDHLPRAIVDLGADKGWRLWSDTEANVHYAVYRFADMDRLGQGMGSDRFKALIADYDRTWPGGVTRTREILSLVDEAVVRTPA